MDTLDAPLLLELVVVLLLPLYAGIAEVVFREDRLTSGRRVEVLVRVEDVEVVEVVEDVDEEDVLPPALLEDVDGLDVELRPNLEVLEREDDEVVVLVEERAEIKARLIFLIVARKFSSSNKNQERKIKQRKVRDIETSDISPV